jgi:hypothetical protein
MIGAAFPSSPPAADEAARHHDTDTDRGGHSDGK